MDRPEGGVAIQDLFALQANPEYQAWLERYNKGIDYWKNLIPGLALLYQIILESKPLPSSLQGHEDDIKFALGLGYLACHEPHNWGSSHLPVWLNYELMAYAVGRLSNDPKDEFALIFSTLSQAMRPLEPQPSFEEKLVNVGTAYAVIGQRGTGKGTVLQEMEKLGVSCAASSRGLREVMRVILNRNATTPELVEMGQQFKNLWGFDIFIRMILWQIMSFPPVLWQKVAVDGLRTEEEINMFREIFGQKAKIIAVIRPGTETDEAGWVVIQQRQAQTGKIEYASFEEFVTTQQRERDRITGLIAMADYVIVNDGSLEDLERKIRELIEPG